MAAAKVEIIYEAEASSLKAVVNEVNKTNSEIVSSAKQTATKFGDEFKNASKSAAQAFGNGQINGAIKSLNTQFNSLTTGLKLNTDAFKKFDVEVQKTNQIIVNSSQDVAKYEDRLRELSVAGQRATQEFEDIAKAVGEYKSAIIAADRAVDLYAKSTDAATGRIGELEDKLYDLALAGQSNTKEFKDLVTEVAKVKRAITETDAQIDSFVDRSRGFGTVVQNIELVGNAFQVVEGAAALFGDENEELQKTLVKLQAITAITSGLEQTRLILIEQSAQKTGIAAIAQKGYNLAVGTSTGLLKGFRLALAATGIGLIVIGLIALVQNFDKVKKAFSDFNESKPENGFAAIGKTIVSTVLAPFQLLIKGIEKVQSLLGDEKQVQKNKGLIDQIIADENRKLEAKTKAIEREISIAQAQNKNTTDLEIQKEKVFIEFAQRKLKIIKDNAVLAKTFDIDTSQIQFKLQQEILDRENTINVLRIENKRTTVAEIQKIESKGFAGTIKLAEEEQKKLAEFNKLRVQSAETQIAILQNVNDTAIINGQNTLDRRVEQIRLEGEARKISAKESIADQQEQATAITKIDAETQAAISAERKKSREDEIQEIFDLANATAEAFGAVLELQKQISDNRIADIEKVKNAEISAIEQSTDSERKKQDKIAAANLRAQQKIKAEKTKQAQADKAIAVFEAIIGTAAAVASAKTIPLKVLAGIIGATQLAIILAQPIPKFKKGGIVGGRSHEAGGTMIEAEKGEFVVNRSSVARHRDALDAMNRSSAAFKKYVDERYVRPALMDFAAKNRGSNVTVNASLNSKSMEREIKGLRKDLKGKSTVININSSDSRYQWQ
jgi:uncharacterized protein YigA (DUF484 family)